MPQEKVDENFRAVSEAISAIAATAHQRSPRARLVFVDYATILPAADQRLDRLPLSEQEQLQRGSASRSQA